MDVEKLDSTKRGIMSAFLFLFRYAFSFTTKSTLFIDCYVAQARVFEEARMFFSLDLVPEKTRS